MEGADNPNESIERSELLRLTNLPDPKDWTIIGSTEYFSEDLKLGKSESLEEDVDSSTLTINMEEEVFCLGYIPLDIFEQKLKDALKKAKHNKVKLDRIDLSKNGYVTDAVIKNLVHIMGKNKLSRINTVSLEGCSIITDQGIHWLAQGFSKNIYKVNINGCSLITDGGLATLANVPSIECIEAMATSVSHMSQTGNTQGCPLLVNPSLKTMIKKDSYVVIIPMATKHSLSEFLKTKIAKQRGPFHYLKDVDILSWSVNVAELEQNHVLFEHILPPCPVHVIIPFPASHDVQELKEQIIETISHVISKEYPNPKHIIHVRRTIGQSNRFMGDSLWNNCSFSQDGILRNIAGSLNAAQVVSREQMSRTNNYFEVECIFCEPKTTLIIGIINSAWNKNRVPLEDRDSELVIERFELEAGAVYGFGIRGDWKSEYVLSEGATYYCTNNGNEVIRKMVPDQSLCEMFPIICVDGENSASVKILSQACPPETLVKQWEEREQYWTPRCLSNNIMCDDRGIMSSVHGQNNAGFFTISDDQDVSLMLCQEEITKRHNTFVIQVLEMSSSGAITIGVGHENYPLGNHPGWCHGSLALHGDDGRIFVENGLGMDPSSGICQVWKSGDVIKAIVSIMGESETIQLDEEIQVDFYVNTLLMATVKHKMTGDIKGIRFMFMVSMKGEGAKAKVLNYRPVFLPKPPRMDMLTMGRSHLLNIYDDGRLVYRPSENSEETSLFLSKTPFNAKLTYFELKVNNLQEQSNAAIGVAFREYPISDSESLGMQAGSVGYYGRHGKLYFNGVESSEDREEQDLTYRNGDIVGCGFDAKSAKFREDGSLENQQILRFYFCKNGKKVHEVNFEYLSDGIYPGANIYSKRTELSLSNYYPGPANGQQLTEARNEQVASKQEEKFVEGCRFTLVSVGDKESASQEKLQALQELLKEGLEFPMLSVIDRKIKNMESDPKIMNLQGQQLYSQLHWQKECLERFLTSRSRLRVMSVDVSTGQGHKELVEHIAQVCEVDLVNHVKYYDLNECVYQGLDKITTALASENFIAANQIMDMVCPELGQNGKVFEAAVHYLKTKGHLLTIPYKKTHIAVDIRFAERLIHVSDTPPNVFSGKIAPCIGEKIKIWNKITDILPDLQQTPHKSEFLKHVLQFLGVFQIPCLRVNKTDPLFCYCAQAALRDLSIQLSHFTERAREDVVLIRREYQFLYSKPCNIFPVIISKCMLFFRPLAISQEWSAFQSGAAQTVLYLNEDHGLTVETRCFMPSQRSDHIDGDTQYNVKEYTFNIFCIFIDIIDYITATLKIRLIYTEQVPPNLVNSSIGCRHQWSLSAQTYRQTVCTLCSHCCDKGQSCPYSGLSAEYEYQCGCKTQVTGCKDCGICQSCADQLWAIRSYLRPNLEVASYNEMKSSQFIPLNATTYDEVEFTNLGTHRAPICLQMNTDRNSISPANDNYASLTKMFPAKATVFPNQEFLQKHMKNLPQNRETSKLMSLEQGDTITIKLAPLKRDTQKLAKVEEECQLEIVPVYFTSSSWNTRVWHETGIVVSTKSYKDDAVSQFISASPLTPECSAFSFQIMSTGRMCTTAIGVCYKRSPPRWSQGKVTRFATGASLFTDSQCLSYLSGNCVPGDIMKCQLNFQKQSVSFHVNDKLVYDSGPISNFGNYHAAVSLRDSGEAVRLLEKEPWQMPDNEEPTLPSAFDSYSYGNMQISPGKTLNWIKNAEEISAWLIINNPSRSPVGYKISSPLVSEKFGYLKPSMAKAFRILINPMQDDMSKLENELCVDVHWFLLESNYDYSEEDIFPIYLTTAPESLMKHQLKAKITEVQTTDSQPLKLTSEVPDASDRYIAEVFKNGTSVQKYWLKGDNYVWCLPQKCSILVRYPKFPTLCLPNGFQKGMRVVVDITKTQKVIYAEALIEEATPEGDLRLMYSEPGKSVNTIMEANVTSSEITLKGITCEHEQQPVDEYGADVSRTDADKLSNTRCETETEKAADMSLISFQPRGNITATKRAYRFAPFHLLTETSKAAVISLDSAWKANTLNSVAQCKTLPTRLTVQELQINNLVGNKLDWLVGDNPSQKFDLAFAFMPVKLGYMDLLFPSIPDMFIEVSVHRLCFLVDQMYYTIRLAENHKIILDAPLHFVNVAPTPPDPPLSADVMFASPFNGWTYSTLYSNKLYLPLCDQIFAEGKPEFSRVELEQLMKSLIHVYAAQCHIFAEQHGGIMFQKNHENGTQIVSSSIKHMDKVSVRKTDKMELSSDTLIRKKFRNNVYCKAHQWCLSGTNIIMDEEFSFRSELFQPYEETVNFMYREMANVTTIRPDFYSFFLNLQYLKLQGCNEIKKLPDGISKCLRLEMVSLNNSAFEELPADLFEIPLLQKLHCVDLRVQALPTSIIDSSPITELILANLLLTSVPKELGALSNLECLNLNSNPLEILPMELKSLTRLKTLFLCGIPWIATAGSKVEMPLDQFEDFLKTNSSLKHYIGKEKLIALFHKCDQNNNGQLDENEIATLNAHLFWNIPRLGASCISSTEYGGVPPVIFLLHSLETLHLDFQAITSVPVHILRLHNLRVLSIANNPLLESLHGSLGLLGSLKSLRLISNPSLRTPPHEIVSRGFAAVMAYLKRLAGGFTECRRTKLMLVGLGGAGKTSLLRALMSSDKRTSGTNLEDITNGIDIHVWKLKTSDNLEVTYNTWDFAGQTLYYNTHQFFLSKRAVYLLLWSTRQGFEHAGLEFWLSSIASHAPKTPIFVVGTHCDQVPKADIPMADLRERYPQIAGFHFVSSVQGIGIVELEKDLLRVTLELKNMGEKIPQVWLNLEKKILAARVNTSILPWKEIKDFGTEIGIFDEKDIREAIQFLHELGTVQYFDNEFLRDQVVINPQWIVNVMSCLVSVKNSAIKDGKFFHKDIPEIWKSYPTELHEWLLWLTEEFDLTFPLPDEKVNIVPCLLPHEVPANLDWPVADIAQNLKETRFIYRFTYLPAGLFNRVQVRLFQFSDGKMIWKRGSLLKKNKHQALILQISDSELQVKVQGPRPENVVFLIHEIIESLIQESFHGVVYEFLVPCPDCINKEGTLEPCMFKGSFVRRARDHKAPFMQCKKYFHTISMAQLYEMMPSDSASDIDVQLQNSLTIMQQLISALSTDVTIVYSARDQNSDHSGVSPVQIKKDLEEAGLKCWYSDTMDTVSAQDIMLALKNCKVVVALLSDNFEKDDRTRDLLHYTLGTLVKDFVIVVIRDSLEWENTDLGMRIGKQEEKIMIRNKSRYDDARVGAMITAVKSKLQQNQQPIQYYPSVFISYCWLNSKDAQSRGTKCPPQALGWGDPRKIKLELEKRGLSCWIDVDQPAAGKGLFRNISEGIMNSKIIVAFVSNEYVNSDNCMMELRFATINMNLPVIVAVVGTGMEWKLSEVGMLMQRAKAVEVNFQVKKIKAMDKLETQIKQRLPNDADNAATLMVKPAIKTFQKEEKPQPNKEINQIDSEKSVFQEEYELMQRKFMRHIISFVKSMDSVPTPHLIVVDFVKHGFLSRKDDPNEANDTIVPTKYQSVKSSLRPKFARRSSRNMKFALDDADDKWENMAFCLKVLCEDEKGWHMCEKFFPVNMNDEFKNVVKGCSAYLARMYAILRQSAVTLNCFDGPQGAGFTSWIEQNAPDNINFIDSYKTLRTQLEEGDKAKEFLSQLRRCHLPTGKIYWLCDKHSSGLRITHLSTEVATRSEIGQVQYEEDIRLKEKLEHSEIYQQKKIAKRPSSSETVIPKILDAFPQETLVAKKSQVNFTAFTPQHLSDVNQGKSDPKSEDTPKTEPSVSKTHEKDISDVNQGKSDPKSEDTPRTEPSVSKTHETNRKSRTCSVL